MTDRGVEAAGPRMSVLAQYVKDLSFENPNAPNSLGPRETAPNIEVKVNVGVRQLSETDFEVALTFDGKAGQRPDLLFAFEVVYAGVFRLVGVPLEAVHQIVMVDCPELLFPFARQTIADAVRNGGFAPLYLDRIDFARLHATKVAESAPKAANLS